MNAVKEKTTTPTGTVKITPGDGASAPVTPVATVGTPYMPVEGYVPAPLAHLFQRFTDDVERLVGEFGIPGRFAYTPALLQRGRQMLTRGIEGVTACIPWTPKIEVCTRGDTFVCSAELPGLDKSDVKVEVAAGVITITGEKKCTVEKNAVGTYHSEYTYGSFYRQVPLPEGCDIDQAVACFTNGILTVTVPLPVGAKCRTRNVEIKTV